MKLSPLKITILYACLGGLWILFSDVLLAALFRDPATLTRLSIYKGLLFILITAGILYLLIWRLMLELEESTRGVKSILESITDAFVALDTHWRYTYVNEKAARIFGRQREDMIGKHIWTEFPEGIGQPFYHAYYRAVEEQTPIQIEAYYFPYDRWFENRIYPSRHGLAIFFQDITERKRAEEELREREERFRAIASSTPDHILVQDRELRYSFVVNPQLGLTEQDMVGKTDYDFLSQEEADKLAKIKRQVMETGEPFHFATSLVSRDGEQEFFDGTYVPRFNDQGKITGLIGHFRNVTKQKKAEEALRRNEQMLRLFIEHSPAAIAMFDRHMKYLAASRRFLIDYNLGDQNIIGRSHYDVFPEIPERWKEIHRRSLAGAVEKSDEDLFPRADGSIDFVRWEILPWHESTGEIGGLILFSEVITARKKAEMELEKHRNHLEELVKERTTELRESQVALTNLVDDLDQKSKALEAANVKLREVDRLRSLFIASMSHELRTPLNSVIGFSSIILNEWVGPLNAEQKENLATVLRSGKHLLSLINDVIDVSKIEAGQIEIARDDFDLYEVLGEAAASLEKEIKGKGLELMVENIHQPLNTDRRRLLQCLLNLMSNAMKYTEKGSVCVSAWKVNSEQTTVNSRDFVEISVSDTGIGIGEGDREKIFQAFTRLDSPLKSLVSGTGLGLYLTRKLVGEVLHGEIAFTSEPGKGSRFVIKMPVNSEQ